MASREGVHSLATPSDEVPIAGGITLEEVPAVDVTPTDETPVSDTPVDGTPTGGAPPTVAKARRKKKKKKPTRPPPAAEPTLYDEVMAIIKAKGPNCDEKDADESVPRPPSLLELKRGMAMTLSHTMKATTVHKSTGIGLRTKVLQLTRYTKFADAVCRRCATNTLFNEHQLLTSLESRGVASEINMTGIGNDAYLALHCPRKFMAAWAYYYVQDALAFFGTPAEAKRVNELLQPQSPLIKSLPQKGTLTYKAKGA